MSGLARRRLPGVFGPFVVADGDQLDVPGIGSTLDRSGHAPVIGTVLLEFIDRAGEVRMFHQGGWSSMFGVRARMARWPLTNSWRKYHLPALTSGTSAVQISPAPFFQPVIFRPPLAPPSRRERRLGDGVLPVPESSGPKTSVSVCGYVPPRIRTRDFGPSRGHLLAHCVAGPGQRGERLRRPAGIRVFAAQHRNPQRWHRAKRPATLAAGPREWPACVACAASADAERPLIAAARAMPFLLHRFRRGEQRRRPRQLSECFRQCIRFTRTVN